MPRYWENRVTGLVANGGQKTLFVIKCPSRCILSKLAVQQTSGTLVNFTLSIFTSEAAAEAFILGTLAAEHTHRVMEDLTTTTPGVLFRLFEGSTGVYENQEGGPANKRNRIYIVINPGGSQPNLTFDLAIGAIVPVSFS